MVLFPDEFALLASIMQRGGDIETPRRSHEIELLSTLLGHRLVRIAGGRWALTLRGRVATYGGKWRPGLPLDYVSLPMEAEQN